MNLKPALLFSLVVLSAGVVGCDPQRVPPGARRDPLPAGGYPVITVEAGLQPFIGVDDANVKVTEGSIERPMTVSVPIRSLADNQAAIQYEFTWFDKEGRELRRGGWKFTALEPRLQKQLQGNAMDSQSAGWRLEIRSAR